VPSEISDSTVTIIPILFTIIPVL